MTLPDAALLGLIQGLTVFLPISSTGHLILIRSVLGMSDSSSLAFDAVLHFATVAAIVTYFFSDIWQLINTGLRKLGRLPVNERDETVLYALLVGSIPALILGVALQGIMTILFHSPWLVTGVLVAGAIFFMYAEWVYHNSIQINDMTIWKGLKIGLFQCLAVIPGFSRSGAAIGGGMLLGLDRSEATRFSFLLAAPVLTGIGAKLLLELIVKHEAVNWMAVAVGAGVAFAAGLLAIKIMVSFMREHTLWPFIWYRVILAGFVVFFFVFG